MGLLTALMLVAATACSSSGGSHTSSGGSNAGNASGHPAGHAGGSASAAFCSSLAALKSSVRSVKQTKASDPKQLKANLTAVRTDLGKLADSLKSQYPNESAAIHQDYESLKSSLDIAIQDPSYPTIAQVKSNFTTLWNVVGHFVSTTAAGC